MKNNEIIGKRIIDKNVKEIGKVAELSFDSETFELKNLYAVIGNAISKKYYQIQPKNILAIGDFMQISNIEDELKDQIIDKIPKEDIFRINNILGKKVIDINAKEIGKISNIEIDIDNQKIKEFTITQIASIGKTNKTSIIKDDIIALGEYILLNKEVTYEKKVVDEDTEDGDEKVNVDIE